MSTSAFGDLQGLSVLSQPLVLASVSYRTIIIFSGIMDEDATSTPLKMCFICDGPETPIQKLVQATPKGYLGLLA